jgi:hypothetical protein
VSNGDDDFYVPGAFEIVAAEFEQNPSVGVVSGNCDHIRNNGTLWLTLKAGFTNRRDLIEYWRHWGRAFLPAPSTFFLKRVIEVVGGFDEANRYAMDYHHWIKITEKFGVKTIDKVLANFRYDEGTVSFSHSQEQLAEVYSISKRYWGSKATLAYYRLAISAFEYHRWRPFKERLGKLWERMRNSLKYRAGQLVGR